MIKKIKRFMCNPIIRFNYLSKLGFYNNLTDEEFIRRKYELITGKHLNLDHPVSYNEKLQWLKLYDKHDEYVELVDKYQVKKIVASKIGQDHIIPTIGVWNSPQEIDFDSLPNQFVLKTTHDSGGVVICDNKAKLDVNKTKKYLHKSLKRDFYKVVGREYPYKNVPRKIIAEKYMVDESGTELKDYKVFCFNGVPKFIQVDFDRFTGHKRNLYTTDWQYIPASIEFPTDPNHKIEKPQCLDELLFLAKKLSEGFVHVRTDFYIIGKEIYFGELTFFHGSGFETFTPDSFGVNVGNLIDLNKKDNKEK